MSASGFNSDLAGKAAGGRRLIAVVYADMVGYSRLIGLDDTGTLGRLRSLRWALIDPTVREHGGNIVQTGGDLLLVAFDSIDVRFAALSRCSSKFPYMTVINRATVVFASASALTWGMQS